ncbi:MAG: phosphotransferase [Rhodospirillales bacterium]|nr:phosphotransferase [Rhodospirillales bacterium]
MATQAVAECLPGLARATIRRRGVSEDVAAIDEAVLARYLPGKIEGFGRLQGARKFAGGQSNPTFLLTADSGRYVLRRKPPGQLLQSAHAVDREFRAMAALAGTGVPVPKAYHLCEDEEIIGSVFFVMEYLEGRIFWDPALPEVAREERGPIFDAMNRALAALHLVEVEAVGLADFGRPGNYFARQVSRWWKQYQATGTQYIPEMEPLAAWLEERMPEDDGKAALVHGDYRLDNIIFAPDTPADAPKMLGVLDWELSTLGHPWSDLAYQCMQWRLPNEGVFRGLGTLDRREHGLPDEADYVAAYCRRCGIDGIPIWSFCLAFSFFRLAAILQGVLKRALDGNASNPERGLKMGAAVPILARMAIDVIEQEDR